jgi:tetratricopeptide (TPR) repeat protein
MGIKDAMEHFKNGKAYYDNNEWGKAIEEFSKTIEQMPDNVEALLNRAHAYRENRNIDKAVEDIEKALEIYPNNSYANEFLGHALAMQSAKNQLFGNA